MRHSEYTGRRTEMEHRSPISRSMVSHQGHHNHQQQRHYHNHHLEMAALPPFNRDTTTMMMSDTTTTVDGSPMTTAFNADTKPVMTRMADHRRSNKPIMEKRRRARINSCLGELKGLILQAMKKDPSRHSKLEKADILEMTVKHLQNLQRQQMAVAVSTDPTVITKFRAGFSECATEVASYVGRIDGVDNGVRQRLVGHLRSCITGLNHLPSPGTTAAVAAAAAAAAAAGFGGQPLATFQSASDALNILSRTPLTTVRDDSNNHAGTTLRMFAGLHLLPSRLPNGDIAFVLPHKHQDGRSSTTPPTSELSDDDACDEDEYCESVNRSAAPPPQLLVNRPAAVSTSDRRTPSAFTSVLNATSSGNVQSNPQAIAESASSTSSSSKEPVSSSTTAAGPSGTIGPSEQVVQLKAQMSAKVGLPRDLQAQPRPSTSSVCSTTDNEKMWRPW